LPLLRAVGDRTGEAVLLSNIGTLYAEIGEKEAALDYFNQALTVNHELGDKSNEATALGNIASVYFNFGEKPKAAPYYQQSLALMRATRDRGGEALRLYNLAVLDRDRGDLLAALRQIEAALALSESLRALYTNQDLRAAYFASVQDYYEFYIDLLMRLHKLQPQAGRAARALQASEGARARALLDMLTEAGADIRQGIEPQLLARERALQQQLNTAARAQIKLLGGQHTDEQAAALAKEIAALTTEYQQVESEIRQQSPRYAALTQPQPLSPAEMQAQVLDADTLLLEYALGDERSYLWAVTRDGINSYELPKRAEIEETARQAYALFTHAAAWSQQTTQRGLFGSTQPEPRTGARR
jgi:tetratricopeptide (TPR) repeat protein